MDVLVFLLRGINVGGSGRLPMATLREVASGLGMASARTYIQSGNLVARWDRAPDEAAEQLRTAISGVVDFTPGVLVRTGEEIRRVVDANPFAAEGADPKELHVTFLDDQASVVVDAIDIDSFAPERVVAIGRDLHLHLPSGIGRSALATAVSRTGSGRTGTTRNWRTVTKLRSMVDDIR